jgi:hypothetical protein
VGFVGDWPRMSDACQDDQPRRVIDGASDGARENGLLLHLEKFPTNNGENPTLE